MDGEARKAAIAAYKKRESPAGIYAVRFGAGGAVFVGQTPDLDAIPNRLRFALRVGTHPGAALQRAWTEHGAGAFSFEVLERLEPEESAYIAKSRLKERFVHWRTMLGAETV